MSRLNENCLKDNDFKQNLWLKLSSECSGGAWCYYFSEKRLFLIVLFITFFLMVIYFSGRLYDIKNIQNDIYGLDDINAKKLNELNNASQSSEKILFSKYNNE